MLEVKWNYPTMDEWQIKLMALVHKMIEHKDNPKKLATLTRNFILMCGRQVGKSEIVAKAISELLLNIPNIKLLIVSGVERQASGLYKKVQRYIEDNHPKMLPKGKARPLRTNFRLKNKSELITEPLGLDGSTARQHTVHGVIFEEMQLIPEEAFPAITPMLLTTNGFIWMLGTAWATEGYVYERLSDPDFYVERVNAEEVAEGRPEPNRTFMLEYLKKELARLGEAFYAQEYLAIPSDRVRQIFNDKLIARCLNAVRGQQIISDRDYICGLDPAGLGEDVGSISIFDYYDENKMVQVEHEITEKLYTTETTQRIIDLDKRYDFQKIYIDDGGLGFGVLSELLKDEDTKFKVIPLNNSSRALDYKNEKRKKILAEDMVFNLLTQMERGRVSLLPDPEIRESLKSYKFEYNKKTKKLMINSNYNHPVQSIMRAVWHIQTKDLKLSIHTIRV